MSKVPYFVEEIGPDGQNMRRTLGESAFFVMGKTRARVQIPIFATPLVRKRWFCGALQTSTQSDCFSHFSENREKSHSRSRGVANQKKRRTVSNEKPILSKKRPRLGGGRGACIESRPVKRLSSKNAGSTRHAGSCFGPTFLAPLGKDDGSFNTNSLKLTRPFKNGFDAHHEHTHAKL